MFYHRQREIKDFKNFFSSKKRALLVYGKRRVGKTTLIKEALKEYEGMIIFFQCTSESYENNLLQFTKEIESVTQDEWRSFNTFYDAFKYLVSLNRPLIVVFDEYNELKESYGGIETDSMMQKIIDSLKESSVRVILSGSSVSIMSELLDSSNPLFDRFYMTLKIKDFNYYEASVFAESWRTREKVSLYSVFGGSPAVLEEIDINSSLDENIVRLLLDSKGSARELVENTLIKEFNKIGPALSILSKIGNGKKTYGEIKDIFDPKNTGNLSKWLNRLSSNDIIRKVYPINEKENNKRSFYTISDNLFRFYFTYVYPNRSRIDAVGAENVYINLVKPSLETFISYRFEEIAKEYFSRKAKDGEIKDIIDIGSYSYDNKKKKQSGEFDVVLEFVNGFDVYECKFLKEQMNIEIAKEEEEKIKAIESFKARNIGFVSLSGFSFSSDKYILIDGEMLFS